VRDIRRLGPDDHDALSDLSDSRSWGRTPQKWAVMLACADAWGIDDGAGGLLASITLARYDVGRAVIGGMLVRPDHERRGIATALLRLVLDAVGDEPVLLYATPYGEALYRRLGFVDCDRVVRHAGPGIAGPPSPGVEVGPPTERSLACLARLDADAFGADRTAMIAAIGSQPGALVAVHRSGGAAGVAWQWDDVRSVGPVTAASAADAAEVVAALSSGAGRCRIDLHRSQVELARWCAAHGLPPAYEAPAMVRPAPDGAVPVPVGVTYRALASQGLG